MLAAHRAAARTAASPTTAYRPEHQAYLNRVHHAYQLLAEHDPLRLQSPSLPTTPPSRRTQKIRKPTTSLVTDRVRAVLHQVTFLGAPRTSATGAYQKVLERHLEGGVGSRQKRSLQG